MATSGKLSNKNPEALHDVICSLFQDVQKLPFRKSKGNTDITEVHKGDSIWEKRHDNQVFPLVVQQSASDISNVLEEASNKSTKGASYRERLQRIADYAGGLLDEIECIQKSEPVAGSREQRKVQSEYRALYRRTRAQLKCLARMTKEAQQSPLYQDQST